MADNRATAMQFLLGKGLTRAQAAGVVGSLMQESGVSATAKNTSSGALGIGQWLGGRKAALLSQGDPGSLRGQLDFLWGELKGPESAALQRLKGAHTVADAASAFTWGFERPGKAEANMANRVNQGRLALKLGGASASASGGDSTSSTTTVQTDPSASVVAALDALPLPKKAKFPTAPIQAPSFSSAPVTSGQAVQTQAPEKRPSALDALKKLDIREPQTTTTTTDTSGGRAPATTTTGSDGRVVIDPNADRAGVKTNPAVVDFAKRVAGVAGLPIRIGTGTNHSRLTVDGNVSQHWSGDAADIPATGQRLIRLGQSALIAAGMSKSEARKQTGGLFNVGGRQIIFNTQEGGDHTTHLHIGI